MAPKKKSDDSMVKIPKKRAPKKDDCTKTKGIKKQTKSKTPKVNRRKINVIKIKIPSPRKDAKNKIKDKTNLKVICKEEAMKLTNEVAMLQLVKPKPQKPVNNTAEIEIKKVIMKPPGVAMTQLDNHKPENPVNNTAENEIKKEVKTKVKKPPGEVKNTKGRKPKELKANPKTEKSNQGISNGAEIKNTKGRKPKELKANLKTENSNQDTSNGAEVITKKLKSNKNIETRTEETQTEFETSVVTEDNLNITKKATKRRKLQEAEDQDQEKPVTEITSEITVEKPKLPTTKGRGRGRGRGRAKQEILKKDSDINFISKSLSVGKEIDFENTAVEINNIKGLNSEPNSDTVNAIDTRSVEIIINSSQTSIIDTLSWVDDISTSSNMTTPTKNLVCINGKLPRVEMIDIKKLDKTKNKSLKSLEDTNQSKISKEETHPPTNVQSSKETNNRKRWRKTRSSNVLPSPNNEKFPEVNNDINKICSAIRKAVAKRHADADKVISPNEQIKRKCSIPVSHTNKDFKGSGVPASLINNNCGQPLSSNSSLSCTEMAASSAASDLSQTTKSIECKGINSPKLSSESPSIETSNSNTSSLSKDCSPSTDIFKIHNALKNLKQILSTLDLDFINWIDKNNIENSPDFVNPPDINYKVIQEEADVNRLCMGQRDSPVKLTNKHNKTNEYNKDKEIDVELPLDDISRPYIIEDTQISNNSFSDIVSQSMYKNTKTNVNDIDGDTLSLFAESIMGIDTSHSRVENNYKDNNSDTNDEETESIKSNRCKFKTHRTIEIEMSEPYIPVTLNDEAKLKPICEKQNADSTSVQKDDSINKYDSVNAERNPKTKVNRIPSESYKTPFLYSMLYRPCLRTKSVVFRGYCFFYQISKCNKDLCPFPHRSPSWLELRSKLTKLSDEIFIKEYLLVRKRLTLMQKYFPVYVDECMSRGLTKLLLEMCIDAQIVEAHKNQTLENTLLHLNNKNLDQFEEFLLYDIENGFLCDDLMKMIAETQNFSRFKPVFSALTAFMIKSGRSFKFDVATQILERICILPYDHKLTESLVLILKNTDVNVFKHPMLTRLESNLGEKNKKLFEDLLQYKTRVCLPPVVGGRTNLGQSYRIPQVESKRYTSPDTTNLEGMQNRSSEEASLQIDQSKNAKTYVKTIQTEQSTPSSVKNVNQTVTRTVGSWRKGNNYTPRAPFSQSPYRNTLHKQRYISNAPRPPRHGFY